MCHVQLFRCALGEEKKIYTFSNIWFTFVKCLFYIFVWDGNFLLGKCVCWGIFVSTLHIF